MSTFQSAGTELELVWHNWPHYRLCSPCLAVQHRESTVRDREPENLSPTSRGQEQPTTVEKTVKLDKIDQIHRRGQRCLRCALPGYGSGS